MVLLSAVVLACPGLAGSAQAASDPTYAASYATKAHVATNQARARHDLRALRKSRCLQTYAERQAAAMAAQGELFHQDLGAVLSGCHLSGAGENVAYGFATGKAVVKGWMHSPGHRANILNKRYRYLAVDAWRSTSTNYVYVTQDFAG